MGLALPQAYAKVAHDNVSLTLGHFFHPMGFERYDPVRSIIGNTATYSLFYSELLPVLGVMADWKLSDRVTFTGGFHRGSGNWEDNNNELNGFGAVGLTSSDGQTSLNYVFDIGAEDDAGVNQQYLHSIVFEKNFCDKWTYLFQTDYGFVQNGAGGGQNASWYSVIQALGYAINDQWNVGVRYEWFDDVEGTRVRPAPGPGVWHETGIGGTYKLTPNF